jgi:hypothetical protein
MNKIKFLLNLVEHLSKGKKSVVYIAGKVTGLDVADYTAKFAKTKAMLEAGGFLVLNPVDFVVPGSTWMEAMRISMPLLCMADIIYMQSDWRDSPGAHLEWCTAVKLGLTVIFE